MLQPETIAQLNNLQAAIATKNIGNFEAALASLVQQNQVQAINKHFNAHGLNALHIALSVPNAMDTFDNANFVFHDLSISYRNDQTYGKLTTEEKINILRQLGAFDPNKKLPSYNDQIKIPYRLYFVWRLLSFEEINPNVKTTSENDAHPTALHKVIPLQDAPCSALLMNRDDLHINTPGPGNLMPIHLAVQTNNYPMVEALAERGAQLNQSAYILGYNKKPLELAIEKVDPTSIRTLSKFGAGIGAKINMAQLQDALLTGAVNLDNCAFFGASIYHQYEYHTNLLSNETAGFANTAISWPWEDKLFPSQTDPNKFILAKPTFPFLEHYALLQHRCFELMQENPNNPNFKKLALYFGAYLASQTVTSTSIKEEVLDGKLVEEKVVQEKTTHGTLQALAAYTLATNKDKQEDALNHYYQQRLEAKKNALAYEPPDETALEQMLSDANEKEKTLIKLDIQARTHLKEKMELQNCEGDVYTANDVYKAICQTFNMANAEDKINLKNALTRVSQQLTNMSYDSIFNVFNNWDFWEMQRAALTTLIMLGIVGGSLFILTFLIAFIVAAAIAFPIFPAIMIGLVIALVCVAPGVLGGALVPIAMSGVSAAIDFVHYLSRATSIIKSLNELADQVQLVPSLMSDQTQHLLANLLDGPLIRTKLQTFIQVYQQEINTKLESNFIDDLSLDAHVPRTLTQWQFYPPRRESNIELQEKSDKEMDAKQMGLFEGMSLTSG